ncbi:cAMP-binding domain of CRP or a regulatory subunit of cAMP-dependent protein kinases [Methylobacterium phyllostachyos]|uniref:cAMP-binding domain of CRP or a regulatory subunit of cAMP-dependent protein kinases n=1 Tax=Methylobacterium phyllostachyos TaxID=582672 RepID=A0A1H0IIK8_9HYPH|nr:Crp/Fnr family transcriptional regulator [Methylobacterium phyllostachyos]SDO31242.1 cAMP-binding domain of CRP or a regulatory subunit of cAMP-dependent protein kinases [Methylobacterium phyllostachyos]
MDQRNILLAALSEADGTLLEPHWEAIDLPVGLVLAEPANAIGHAVFVETGLCSVVSSLSESGRIEVGLFGRDGMAIPALVLGSDTIPHQVFMQVAGRGRRIPVPALRAAIAQSPSLRDLLLRYAQTFHVQVAQTAIANAGATAEERLARWLLMYHDRQDGDDLPVTHEFLSIMLGVRRPTVTVAIHTLEGEGLIRARRGRIRVLSRERLEQAAGQAYGPAEAEYERLIGPLRAPQRMLA